jgi:hypothetical protein
MPTRFTGLNTNQQQFALALMFIVALPLAPLPIDLFLKKCIPDSDLYLTFALYIISMGASSKAPALMGLSTILAGAYLFTYGVVATQTEQGCVSHEVGGLFFRYMPVVLFVIVHVGERYNRHIVAPEKFWDF